MANYFLPGYAGQISADSVDRAYDQKSPLYNLYSPRLFGAPPQLTNQCDMRLKSSLGAEPGPVGDWYLDNILRDAQICNIIVGHARFTGGFNSFDSLIRNAVTYAAAISRYSIFDNNGKEITNQSMAANIMNEYNMEAYNSALGDASDESYVFDVDTIEQSSDILENIGNMFQATGLFGTIDECF